MKKVILSLLLIGSSCAVFAQIRTGDSTNRGNRVYNDSMNRMNSDSMNRMYRNNRNNYDSMNRMNRNSNRMNMNSDSMRNNAMRTNDTLSTNRAYSAYGITSANVPSNIQMYFQRDNPSATNVTWQQNGDWYQGTYNHNGHYSHVYYNRTGATYTVSLPVTETYVPDDIINKVSNMYGPTIYDVTTLKSNTDSSKNIYQVRVIENGQLRAQWINEDGSSVTDPFRSTVESNLSTGAYPAMDSSRGNWNNRTDTSSMNNMNNNRVNTNVDTSMNRNYDNNRMNMGDSTRVNTMDSSRMNNMDNSMDSTRNGVNNMNSTDSTQSRNNYNSTNTTDTSSMVTDTSGNANNSQMKTKIKSKSSDGKKTKTKMKNGEMIKQEE